MARSGRTQITYNRDVQDNDKMTEKGVVTWIKGYLDGLKVDLTQGITVKVARTKLTDGLTIMNSKNGGKYNAELKNASAYVVMVQRLLNKAKEKRIVNFEEDLTLDSIIGEKTESAIKAFQTAFNALLPGEKRITVDGLIGPQTIQALLIVTDGGFQSEDKAKIVSDFESKAEFELDELVPDGDKEAESDDSDEESGESTEFVYDGDAAPDYEARGFKNCKVLKLPNLAYSVDRAQKLYKYWFERMRDRNEVEIHVTSDFDNKVKNNLPDSIEPSVSERMRARNPEAFYDALNVIGEDS